MIKRHTIAPDGIRHNKVVTVKRMAAAYKRSPNLIEMLPVVMRNLSWNLPMRPIKVQYRSHKGDMLAITYTPNILRSLMGSHVVCGKLLFCNYVTRNANISGICPCVTRKPLRAFIIIYITNVYTFLRRLKTYLFSQSFSGYFLDIS